MKNKQQKQSFTGLVTTPGALVRHLLLGWLLAATVEYLLLPANLQTMNQLHGLAAMSLPRLLILAVLFAALQWGLSCRFAIAKAQRWMMVGVYGLLSVLTLVRSFTWAFLAVNALVLLVLTVYALKGWNNRQETVSAPSKKTHWLCYVVVAAGAVCFLAAGCAWTVGRVKAFATPNYDFGIFSQMFYYMKQTGLPMTTVERDGLLSHFAVHVSPIYYLLLPFYWIVPTPATLQVLQVAVLCSAVIPVWLLGKQHGFHPVLRVLLCIALLALPVTMGGISYDIHENCFLLPLILWLFYAIDRKSVPLIALFGVLTLCVKEDAAVYVAVAGLYLTVRTVLSYKKELRKDLFCGLGLMAGALIWFFAVTWYLSTYGDGVMTTRYNNFMYDGSRSLVTVVKAVLLSPMKVLYECVDSEKLQYIVRTMLPLLALPLVTRKYQRYILLIPYVLLNLMSDYQYQHDILFQYNFGSTAFLVYLLTVNVADLGELLTQKKPTQKSEKTVENRTAVQLVALCLTVVVGCGGFARWVLPKVTHYATLYEKNQAYYDGVRQALDTIPRDASVTAHTFYVTYLSQRETLYDVGYCTREHMLSTDYVVLKCKSDREYKDFAQSGENGFENLCAYLEENGFVREYTHGSVLVIYKKQA